MDDICRDLRQEKAAFSFNFVCINLSIALFIKLYKCEQTVQPTVIIGDNRVSVFKCLAFTILKLVSMDVCSKAIYFLHVTLEAETI
jgi:hypothetical protein